MIITTLRTGVPFLFILIFLASCATKQNIYHWGGYEKLVEKTLESEEGDPTKQVSILMKDIAKAKEKGKPTPPGVYAHLGYMHYLLQDLRSALGFFNQEKELYPESHVFMNRIIQTIEGKSAEKK